MKYHYTPAERRDIQQLADQGLPIWQINLQVSMRRIQRGLNGQSED